MAPSLKHKEEREARQNDANNNSTGLSPEKTLSDK